MKNSAALYQFLACKNSVTVLVKREWSRVLMEPSRLAGMLLQPLLFLIVFGAGFHENFYWQNGDVKYSSFFFPGILGLVVLFSSIYATLTLVDDKKCGFFRFVLVAPGGVFGAVAGKVLATLTLGFAQSTLFLLLAIFLPIKTSLFGLAQVLGILFLGSSCFSCLGVLFAWLSPSSSAFHALMSIILIPMWLLSGALFPLPDGLISSLSIINPMSYLVAGLRNVLLFGHDAYGGMAGLFAFSLLFLLLLIRAVREHPLE